MEKKTTSDPVAQFAAFAGDAAELISFNRSVGQLYGALFISGTEMSLKELASVCKMSKGNASIHLRILEEWGAVERASRPGTREDYYFADTNLSELVLQRLRQGLTKRLNLAKSKLHQFKEQSAASGADPQSTVRQERVKRLEDLLDRAESFLGLFQKFSKLQELFAWGGIKGSHHAGD